jgi:hypothetical protein
MKTNLKMSFKILWNIKYIARVVLHVQWYLLRAAAQLDVKIALFVNGFVVYH